jgi:Trk-type K+ transport system membrane component
MIAGAVAFFIYASCASWLLMKRNLSSLFATITLIPLWLAASFVLWFMLLR